MKITGLTKLAGAGALALYTTVSAHAGSVAQPGLTDGIATGTPLAPGWYFLDTFDWGVRSTSPNRSHLGVNAPLVAWSTPWMFLGARVQFLAAIPEAQTGTFGTATNGGSFQAGLFNPLLAGQLAWDIGHTGLGFSYQFGTFFGIDSPVADPETSFTNQFALSYTRDGWNLTAAATIGTQATANPVFGDYFNIDLTATKRFGKWEIGMVGFGSTDTTLAVGQTARQSQFALGGLVGYDFGPVILQAYATRDVAQSNQTGFSLQSGFDTRLWGRIIIPFLDPPPAAPAPLSPGVIRR